MYQNKAAPDRAAGGEPMLSHGHAHIPVQSPVLVLCPGPSGSVDDRRDSRQGKKKDRPQNERPLNRGSASLMVRRRTADGV